MGDGERAQRLLSQSPFLWMLVNADSIQIGYNNNDRMYYKQRFRREYTNYKAPGNTK